MYCENEMMVVSCI